MAVCAAFCAAVPCRKQGAAERSVPVTGSPGEKNMKNMRKLCLELFTLLNIILMTLPFAGAWYSYYGKLIISPYYNKGNWLVVFLFAVLYVVFGRIYDAFSISRTRATELAYSQSLSALISDVFMYVVIWLLSKELCNPLPLLLCLAEQILFSLLWAYISQKIYFALFSAKKTAVIYDMRPEVSEQILSSWMRKKYDIVFNVRVEECLEDLNKLVGMETVFLGGVHSHERNIILKYCIEHDIEVFVLPRVGDVLMSGAEKIHMFHLPMLHATRYSPPTLYLVAKRLFDLFASALALLLLSPIFLITAIAIKATDGGPVFYLQKRLTKDGKIFNVIKFRSMRVDAEKDGVARLSTGTADDRITPVGKIIRKIRVDELPQLINILKGDMTICGPRPERPEIAAQYEEELPEFRLRLQAKAGLTGLAQVYGKYNTTPYDKLQMDLMYIANPSILQDLHLMFATIKILFMPESTEGVEAGSVTAMGGSKDAPESKEHEYMR